MEEDLINKTSIQFPTVSNTSPNDSLVFGNMTPMIEIPTTVVLRELEQGVCIYILCVFKYKHVRICMYICVYVYAYYVGTYICICTCAESVSMYVLVLGSIIFLPPVYGITNSEWYWVFHSI